MDSECDLDIVFPLVTPPPPNHQWSPSTQFYMKIYKSGKVYIKRFCVATHNGASAPSRGSIILAPCTGDDISTDDGIRFPPYVIRFLKNLLRDGPNMKAIHSFESCLNICESIKILQEELAKIKLMDPIDEYWFERGRMAEINKIGELAKELTQKDKKISELQRNVKIMEVEKDPSGAELDIRAKEGAKKHAEAKARLQKMYDERPMITLVEGESIGSLLANECIRDLLVCM